MSLAGRTLVAVVAVGLLAQVPMARGRTHKPDASGNPLPRFLHVRGLRFPAVRLDGGTFLMGSSDDEVLAAYTECVTEPLKQWCDPTQFADETPQRTVKLDTFHIDRREVSAEAYDQCVTAGRCKPARYHPGGERFHRRGWPVTFVSWFDARDYCAFVGRRLPTEAEFERAARGSTGRKYPWGELYNSRLANHGLLASQPNSAEDGYSELAPVDSFHDGSTPEGVLNLAGNVVEWVWDRYAVQYSSKDLDNPRGPVSGDESGPRVLRGGHYESPRSDLRGATRFDAAPDARGPTYGFRCAH